MKKQLSALIVISQIALIGCTTVPSDVPIDYDNRSGSWLFEKSKGPLFFYDPDSAESVLEVAGEIGGAIAPVLAPLAGASPPAT